jgi:uncharacterized membrane protein YphA (DoxX/SURF4 family)
MFSIFPSLLTFSLLSTTIIRITIGVILIGFGIACLFNKRTIIRQKMIMSGYPFPRIIPSILGILSAICGCLLVTGFLTQIMAIVAAYVFLNLWVVDKGEVKIFGQSLLFYWVLIIFSMSLILSGAGLFAFDLPL